MDKATMPDSLYCRDIIFKTYTHFSASVGVTKAKKITSSGHREMFEASIFRSVYVFDATGGQHLDFNLLCSWAETSVELNLQNGNSLVLRTVAVILNEKEEYGYFFQKFDNYLLDEMLIETGGNELEAVKALHTQGIAVKKTIPYTVNFLKYLAMEDFNIDDERILQGEIVTGRVQTRVGVIDLKKKIMKVNVSDIQRGLHETAATPCGNWRTSWIMQLRQRPGKCKVPRGFW